MDENLLQWIQLVKLLVLSTVAILYGFGGVSGKWKRRVIAPIVLTSGLVGVSLWMDVFNWWFLAYMPLLLLAYSIGYGANKTKEKIIKRGRAGLAYGVAALPIAWSTHSWTLLGLHIAACVTVSIVLGVWNPTKSARAEETTIGFTSGFLPIMGMI